MYESQLLEYLACLACVDLWHVREPAIRVSGMLSMCGPLACMRASAASHRRRCSRPERPCASLRSGA